MDMREAFRARLVADPAVAAIVGDRVYWSERPQGSPFPAIVLQVISDGRPQHMKGRQAMRPTRIQVDCMATDSEVESGEAIRAKLVEAAIAAVEPEAVIDDVTFRRSFVDAVRDADERTETENIKRTAIDVIAWHA